MALPVALMMMSAATVRSLLVASELLLAATHVQVLCCIGPPFSVSYLTGQRWRYFVWDLASVQASLAALNYHHQYHQHYDRQHQCDRQHLLSAVQQQQALAVLHRQDDDKVCRAVGAGAVPEEVCSAAGAGAGAVPDGGGGGYCCALGSGPAGAPPGYVDAGTAPSCSPQSAPRQGARHGSNGSAHAVHDGGSSGDNASAAPSCHLSTHSRVVETCGSVETGPADPTRQRLLQRRGWSPSALAIAGVAAAHAVLHVYYIATWNTPHTRQVVAMSALRSMLERARLFPPLKVAWYTAGTAFDVATHLVMAAALWRCDP